MYPLVPLRRGAKWLLLAFLISVLLYFMFRYISTSPLNKTVAGYNSGGQEEKQTSRRSSYVLALSYMDQITWASRRVRSLQCWATGLERNIRVVEPFVVGSQLGVPHSQSNGENIRFSDIFDLEWWNIHGESVGFLAMVTWKEFFHYTPSNIILVQIVYEVQNSCVDGVLRTDKHCDLGPMRQHWSSIMASKNFNIIKEVCINFQTLPNYMSVEEFNHLLFGDIPADLPVTVVFNDFRGYMLDHKSKGECSYLLSSTRL